MEKLEVEVFPTAETSRLQFERLEAKMKLSQKHHPLDMPLPRRVHAKTNDIRNLNIYPILNATFLNHKQELCATFENYGIRQCKTIT